MKANAQGLHRLLAPVMAFLLLIGATMMILPGAPTLANPPQQPSIPQPEPFFVRLDQPLMGTGAAGEAVSASQFRIAADPGTWYDLTPPESFEDTFPPADWSVDTKSGTGWAKQTAQHLSGASSAGVVTTTAGTLDAWLLYGGETGLDLSDVPDAELKFSYWLNTDSSGADPVYFGWAASSDMHSFFGARISGRVSQWLTATLDLQSYIIGGDPVWVAFFVSGTSASGTQEVYVDDARIRGMEPYKTYLPAALRNYRPTFTFIDDFSNTGSGWPHGFNWGRTDSDKQNVYDYTDKLMVEYPGTEDYHWNVIGGDCRQAGKYFMRVGTDYGYSVIARSPVQAGSQFTVDADIAFCDNDPYASAGILFGLNDAGTQYYRVILIYDAGGAIKYAVWRDDWDILQSTSPSPYLQWTGNGFNTNHVTIERDGCNLTIYFNGSQEWSTATACAYTDQRWVGLFHDKFPGMGNTGALVDNFAVQGALYPDD